MNYSSLDGDVLSFIDDVYFVLACNGIDFELLKSQSVEDRYNAISADVHMFVCNLYKHFDV